MVLTNLMLNKVLIKKCSQTVICGCGPQASVLERDWLMPTMGKMFWCSRPETGKTLKKKYKTEKCTKKSYYLTW